MKKSLLIPQIIVAIVQNRFFIHILNKNFTKFLLDSGHTSEVAFIDENQFPIIIEDVQTFYDDIIVKYFEAVNEYSVKFADIKNKKNAFDDDLKRAGIQNFSKVQEIKQNIEAKEAKIKSV